MKNFARQNSTEKITWGVLGKIQTYEIPNNAIGKEIVPLNKNAFESWDAKKSNYRIRPHIPQNRGGVVPQLTPTPPDVTPTSTPTPTQTGTPILTQTGTPTGTPTSTPTPTQTGTPAPTQTGTPTGTPTPTQTGTPTGTPAPTQTGTPTGTPTNTPTPTQTGTPTPTPSSTPSGPSFDPDAAAYLSAVLSAGGTGVTATVSGATDTLFTSLKSAGLYNDISAMWLQLGGVASSCLLESKLQTAFNLQFFGGMTHSYSGSTGNNTNAYADPSFTQSLIDPSNVYFAIYVNNSFTVATLDTFEMGCGPGYRALLGVRHNGTNLTTSLGDSSALSTISNPTQGGFYMINTDNSANYQTYRNGVQVQTVTRTFTTPVPTHKYLLWNWAINGVSPWGSGYSNARMSSIIFGTNMDATKQATLNSLINDFETTLNRNF